MSCMEYVAQLELRHFDEGEVVEPPLGPFNMNRLGNSGIHTDR